MDGKMLILEVLIAFALLLQSTSTAVTDSVFRNRMSQGNTVYSGHLLFESPARSRLNCLVMCSLAKCCVRFTYTGMRGNPGTCRGHSTQNFPSEAGVNVDRTAMYVWTGLREVDGKKYQICCWLFTSRVACVKAVSPFFISIMIQPLC